MLGEAQRKSTVDQLFQEDATKIPYNAIKFEMYALFAAQSLGEDDLRNYIEKEMDNFKHERLEEVSVFCAF